MTNPVQRVLRNPKRRVTRPGLLGMPVGKAFDPATLFAAGEVGAWYDPSDFSTMQVAQGMPSSNVVALGSQVGVLLDKSKGLARGPELVGAAGLGDSTAGWNAPTNGTWVASGGVFTLTNTGAAQASVTLPVLTVGKWYEVFIDKKGATAASGGVALGSSNAFVFPGAVQSGLRYIGQAVDGSLFIRTNSTTAGATVSVDNISVREILGIHAGQTVAGQKPVLSARYNMTLKSDQLADATWNRTDTTPTANAVTGPDGQMTGTLLTEGSAGTSSITQSYNTVSGVAYIARIVIMRGNHDWQRIQLSGPGATDYIRTYINLATGDMGSPSVIGSAVFNSLTCKPLGSGWYEVAVAGSMATTTITLQMMSASGDNAAARINGGTHYIQKVDFRPLSDNLLNIPTYQRVNTATDYDSVGFPPFLSFDGVDDGLVTGTLPLSGVNAVTVVAGVIKDADSAACLIESSVSAPANTGSFGIYAPLTTGGLNYSYRLFSGGDSLRNTGVMPLPHAAVHSMRMDLGAGSAGGQNSPRINGATPAGLSGGGFLAGAAFGNYPAYLMRRGGASMPMKSRFYGAILRGAMTDDVTLARAERALGKKMSLSF